MELQFFMAMDPPTATAQEKQCTIGPDGKRRFYKNSRLVAAEEKLEAGLIKHIPGAPLMGALALQVIWLFPANGHHKHGDWRTSRPDTDNLNKLLKDAMTKVGFWKDDSQVVHETIQKIWTEDLPGIHIHVREINPSSGLKRISEV